MSDAPVIKGTDAMTAAPKRQRYSRMYGETTEYPHLGPWAKAKELYVTHRSAISAGASDYDEVSLNPLGGGKGEVVLIRADDDDGGAAIDPENNAIWEAHPLELQKDLRAHPYFQVSGGLDAEIAAVDAALARGSKYDTGGVFANYTKRYQGLRMAGVSRYLESGISLKKTIVAARRSLVEVAWANINRTVKLVESSTNGAEPAIDPPSEILEGIADITRLRRDLLDPVTVPYPDGDVNYWEDGKWEWLKKTPVVRQEQGGKRYRIMYEWWGAEEWSTILYVGGWDPQVL